MLFFSPTRRTALDVATAHVILVAFCRLLSAAGGSQYGFGWAPTLVEASTVALGTLLAMWVSLGSGLLWKRVVDLLAGLMALSACRSIALGHDLLDPAASGQWTLGAHETVGVALLGAIVGGAIARLHGWRWCNEREAPLAGPLQFTLPEVFWAMAVAAWIFSLDRAVPSQARFWQGGLLHFFGRQSIALDMVLGTLGVVFVIAHRIAAASVGSGPKLRLWLIVAVIAAVYVIGLVGWGAAVNDFAAGRRAARSAALAATLTIAYLLAFRSAGWRVDRPALETVLGEAVVHEASTFAHLCAAAGAGAFFVPSGPFARPPVRPPRPRAGRSFLAQESSADGPQADSSARAPLRRPPQRGRRGEFMPIGVSAAVREHTTSLHWE